jgi:hypothetical protein
MPTPSEAATPSITPEPSNTPTYTPASTPTNTPTYTPNPTQTPVPTPTLDPLASLTTDELLNWLIEAWHNGDSPNVIRPRLENAGWMPPADNEAILNIWELNASQWQIVDLDGDQVDEWLISINTSDEFDGCGDSNLGELWVINGQGLIYQLAVNEENPYWNMPMIIDEVDLTGDGLPEIVTQSVGCGAHTSFSMYHVLSSHNGPIENIIKFDNESATLLQLRHSLYNFGIVDPDEDWSSPGVSISSGSHRIIDSNQDGILDLIVEGGLFNSAGAGWHRERYELWAWNGMGIILSDVRLPRVHERVHVLFDANIALFLGRYDSARVDYINIIEDYSLGDNFLWGQADGGYAITRQFAAFRLIWLALRANNFYEATNWQDWLRENYPDLPLTEAANILISSWQSSKDLSQACVATTEFLNSEISQEYFINPIDVGYGNPQILVKDICPIP